MPGVAPARWPPQTCCAAAIHGGTRSRFHQRSRRKTATAAQQRASNGVAGRNTRPFLLFVGGRGCRYRQKQPPQSAQPHQRPSTRQRKTKSLQRADRTRTSTSRARLFAVPVLLLNKWRSSAEHSRQPAHHRGEQRYANASQPPCS